MLMMASVAEKAQFLSKSCKYSFAWPVLMLMPLPVYSSQSILNLSSVRVAPHSTLHFFEPLTIDILSVTHRYFCISIQMNGSEV